MQLIEKDASQPASAQAILAVLKQQLSALDRIGAHIAAAHCDAAIQQLQLDAARQAMNISQEI
ncbi:hypothetical protein [Erythrobacter sp. WG]|uniref:hypothetical protein n=1 Tax=Erythrobacter sp. WG TaxID=2985510 RepID=UPI0022720E23|nr:hypothetical protein [Erythrobacter sp. WG]MCX9146166.1 hypothetical protein [Erythrobacter sp. WG]